MVRPVVVRDGRVIGTWTRSTAPTRRVDHVGAALFLGEAEDGVAEALERYSAFLDG